MANQQQNIAIINNKSFFSDFIPAKSRLNSTYFKAILTILLTSLMCLTNTSVVAQSRPSPLTRDIVNINAGRSKPFTVYFEYGSVSNEAPISNIVATATIINSKDSSAVPAFEFVSDPNFPSYDIFNGDPSRQASEPAPASPNGCQSFNAPKYTIPTTYFAKDKMERYGLQTAKNSPSNSAILAPKSTGCIALQVKLTTNAKVNDSAAIQFDWDSGPSPDFRGDQKPALVIQPLNIIDPLPVVSSSSSSSQAAIIVQPKPISSSSSSAAVIVATRTGGNPLTPIYLGTGFAGIISVAYLATRKRAPEEF